MFRRKKNLRFLLPKNNKVNTLKPFSKFHFSKSLNKSYNISYNYKYKGIRYHYHFLSRKKTRNLNFDIIEETIKTGKINHKKSNRNKICLERYFGKINRKYVVILIDHLNFVEVRTAWTKKGK